MELVWYQHKQVNINNIFIYCLEIIEGEDNLEVAVVEAIGFGDQINNQKCWKVALEEIERRLDEYLRAEYSPQPIQNLCDGRIHACLYFIAPHGKGLRKLDIDFMKGVHNRVNLIPVIAKADSMTVDELQQSKVQVMREIEFYQISIYRPPCTDEETDPAKRLNSRIPYAIVGSNDVIDINGNKYRGRRYPWGDILVDEPSNFHDFSLVRELLIEEMMIFLKERTENVLYEKFRMERLQSDGQESFYKGIYNAASAQSTPQLPKKVDEDAFEQKKIETIEIMKQKFAAKHQKIAAAEEEIMQKYREIMHDLGEKRKKYEEKLKTFL